MCSSDVNDVIRNAASVGCDYGDILNLVKDASATEAISARVVINALPQLGRSYRAGVQPEGEAAAYVDEELPDMYGESTASAKNSSAPAGSGKGIFGRIDGLWKRR